MEQRSGRNYTRIATVVLLTLGCLYVLKPFLPAILCAAAVVISSWPLDLRLLRAMAGHRSLAALTMTLSLTLLVIIPLAIVAYNLADDVATTFGQLRDALEHGALVPPSWVRDLPVASTKHPTNTRGRPARTFTKAPECQRIYGRFGGFVSLLTTGGNL